MVNTDTNKIFHQDDQLLTPADAAARLKVTSEQVRSLIRQGRLVAINVGTGEKRPLYRISQQALDDFLNRRCNSRWPVPKKKFTRLPLAPDFFPGLK